MIETNTQVTTEQDQPAKQVILVLGMHRSGTSAVTRMINLLGAATGENLLPAQENVNAAGFWENQTLVDINERILSLLSSSWFDFRVLPDNWWKLDAIVALQPVAEAFLLKAFTNDPLVILKDPRLCRLLPFWLDVLNRLAWNPLVVMVSRAPWEVSASLQRRDPIQDTTAHLLWLRYLQEAETESRYLKRVVVDYGELLRDWKSVAGQISVALDIVWPNENDETIERINESIDPALRHQNKRSIEYQGSVERLSGQLYEGLVKSNYQVIPAEMDVIWETLSSWLESCELFSNALYQDDRVLFDINNKAQMLGEELKTARETVAERDQLLEEVNSSLVNTGKQLEVAQDTVVQRDEKLGEVQVLLAETGQQLEHAQSVVGERDGQLKSVQNQLSDLGKQHAHAINVVKERDQQLEQCAGDLHHAHQVITEKDARMAHPMVRLMIKIFGPKHHD